MGRRQSGRGQARQLEKARAAGIRPMARPGAAARRRQECPARAQVASCPPPARPEPPRAGPGARAGGSSAWDASCQAAPSAGSSRSAPLSRGRGIRRLEFAAVLHGITSFYLGTLFRNTHAGQGPGEAQVLGGAREAREDWATGSESTCKQGIDAPPKAIVTWKAPHSRPSRSLTSLKPAPLGLVAMVWI